ncbi:hypothetical protein [Vibrio fluvialis]|uniref:hypothetical protein n=1 Tax=Vibrio fluvialis TaxID=676 RepID=UPI0023A9A802|nr:hypothetical protein [Vibrio fluvialis]MDE5179062.1 hypothetical protein [Vibrio fluvialis]
MNKFYFAVKQKPDGNPVLAGPYDTAALANRAREQSKAPDMVVSSWFVASSDEEAQQRMSLVI